jgi:hypothetical protein
MKKIAFVMAAFMFAATAMGAVTITITPGGDCEAIITYTADANVSAFALDVTVDTGTIDGAVAAFEGECNETTQGYGIFLGTIEILESGDVNDWGSPVGDPCDLPSDTEGGLGTSGVTLEMGALYTTGNQPALSGTLCTLTVSDDCNMTVTENAGRGGIVYENGSDATLAGGGPTNVPCVGGCTMPNVIGLTEAAAIAAITGAGLPSPTVDHVPDNANVGDCVAQSPTAGGPIDCGTATSIDVGYAYPDEWDWPGQCHGDTDGNDLSITLTDFQIFKAAFAGAWDANSDYNRDGTISLADFQIFKVGFAAGTVPGDCVAGDPCGVFDPD